MEDQDIYKQKFIIFLVIFALMIVLPYGAAAMMGGKHHVFGGFLLNPLDGNSYLAKIYQGAEGAWRFTLPFTPEPGEGAYIFLFYLFLGHLCRLTGIPLIWMFHIWRVTGSIFLLIVMRRFFLFLFADDGKSAWRALLLAGIGSGMGWTVFAFGVMTGDFWVAEAYPFLSSYANPHFPIGLGLMLLILLFAMEGKKDYWQLVVVALLLGIIMPFGVAVDCMIFAGLAAVDQIKKKKVNYLPLILIGVFGGAMIAYQVGVTIWDPVFSAWNAQNVTPVTAWWDLLLSFSPVLLVAMGGVWLSRKDMLETKAFVLVVWLVGAILMMVLPVNLQRRFVLGLFIPAAGLGVYGSKKIAEHFKFNRDRLYKIVLGLAVPTNVILLLAGVLGALSKNSSIYLTRAEQEVMLWLEAQPRECLVLADPKLGMFVPGHSGCRVMYGHPFETVNAEKEEEKVESFYSGGLSVEEEWGYLVDNGIKYVIYGERERALGNPKVLETLSLVFEENEVEIYAVKTE